MIKTYHQIIFYLNTIDINDLWINMNIKRNTKDILYLRRNFIYQRFNKYNNKQEFFRKFRIPSSSYYLMNHDTINESKNERNRLLVDMNSSHNRNDICSFVKEIVKPPQKALTIQSIQQTINKKFNIIFKKREIKEFLKSKLRFTYKKGCSTSIQVLSESHKYQKAIFASRIFKEIYDDQIINIDESSF